MHQSTMAEEKAATCKRNLELNSAKMAMTLRRLPDGLNRTITRGKETGAWLTVLPSIVNGTELSAEEFRDVLIMRYGERYGERPSNFVSALGFPLALQPPETTIDNQSFGGTYIQLLTTKIAKIDPTHHSSLCGFGSETNK
jgi:hypothetical protein